MRTFFALVAAATLAYCGYVVLSTPTGGMPLIAFLKQTRDADVLYHVSGVALALIILVMTALRGGPRVENITESKVLDRAQAFIDHNMPWIEKLDQKRGRVQVIIGNLSEMSSRVSVIKSGNLGLAAYVAQVDALLPDLKSRVDSLATDLGGNDLIERADELIQSYDTVRDRLGAVEKLMVKVPAMAEHMKTMQATVDDLENDKTGIFAKIDKLFEALDELLDENDNCRIATLEAGSDNYSDDLNGQVDEVSNRLDEIKDRLEDLLGKRAEIDQLFLDLKELSALGTRTAQQPTKAAA